MKHRGKYGVGLLVAAALGVLAFAASAQATALLSGFFINGASAGLKASAAAKQLGRGTLLIPALKTEINCEKFTITNAFVNSAADGEGTLLYEDCTVLVNEGVKLEEAFGCEIVTNHLLGVQAHHITAKALLLPAELTDNTPAILAEKIEATVLVHEELGCLLPKTTTIKGVLCLKIDGNHTVEPELLASQALQGECKPRPVLESTHESSGAEAQVKDKLLFGINEAFVVGKADVSLTGPHNGLTLGVLLI
jgi:hypothetical protein